MELDTARQVARLNRTLRGIAAGALMLLALFYLADLWLLVFAAALIGLLLRGAGRWTAQVSRMPEGAGVAVVTLGLLALLGAGFALSGAAIAAEAGELWRELSARVQELQNLPGWSRWGQAAWDQAREWITGERAGALAAGAATTALGVLGSTVVLIACALYFATAPGTYVAGTVALLPRDWRGHARTVMADTATTLRWWFIGQVVDMVVVGVLAWIGLMLLGVKLAPVLALVAAICNFVPFVGAVVGAAPAVLVALGEGGALALWTALLFLAVQMLEGNLIAPLVQRRTVSLPPAVTILSQTVAGILFGLPGVVLASPLAAAGMVAVRRVWVEAVLGDPPPGRS